MRELPGPELVAAATAPFVRHQVDPAHVTGWVVGEAMAVLSHRSPRGEPTPGPTVLFVGGGGDLRTLISGLSAAGLRPWRVSVPRAEAGALPPAWSLTDPSDWHWMSTTLLPERVSGVAEVADPDEINALLERANPDAYGRPGSADATWLGGWEDSTLIATGAVYRMNDRTGHLRAVSVAPQMRGRGWGRRLSAALTRLALEGGSGVATLGVYTDNAPAIALYRGLGYDVVHSFRSGLVDDGSAVTDSVDQPASTP